MVHFLLTAEMDYSTFLYLFTSDLTKSGHKNRKEEIVYTHTYSEHLPEMFAGHLAKIRKPAREGHRTSG